MTDHKDPWVPLIDAVLSVEQPHPRVEQKLMMPIPEVELSQAMATLKILASLEKNIVLPKLIVESPGLAYNTLSHKQNQWHNGPAMRTCSKATSLLAHEQVLPVMER